MERSVEGHVDFRVHLEFGRSEDCPEVDTHDGPKRTLGVDKAVSGSTVGGQYTEGE